MSRLRVTVGYMLLRLPIWGPEHPLRRRNPVMKDFIDDCVFTESMAIKWQFMVPDARATLSRAFDVMILCPDMVSTHSSKLCKVSGIRFCVQDISIGYATFLIATNHLMRIVLIDAALKDGDAIVEWHNLPPKRNLSLGV